MLLQHIYMYNIIRISIWFQHFVVVIHLPWLWGENFPLCMLTTLAIRYRYTRICAYLNVYMVHTTYVLLIQTILKHIRHAELALPAPPISWLLRVSFNSSHVIFSSHSISHTHWSAMTRYISLNNNENDDVCATKSVFCCFRLHYFSFFQYLIHIFTTSSIFI